MKHQSPKFEITFDSLPRELPIFPLPGALILPRGHLPLNIFEPRYLQMVIDAVQTPARLIGMIQPLDGESMDDEAPLYTTGCAGRISSFSETEDHRILLSLTGVCRFDVEHVELTEEGYRKVRPRWDRYRSDLEPCPKIEIDRAAMANCLKKYFVQNRMDVDWDVVSRSTDEALVTSLAMVCPFDYKEQQALLEANGLQQRAEMIMTLIEMATQRTCKDKSGCTH
jgi:Lon protease-like protein